MIFFKSPTVKFPAFVIQSLRNVPEFIIAQSALTAFMNKKKKHERIVVDFMRINLSLNL